MRFQVRTYSVANGIQLGEREAISIDHLKAALDAEGAILISAAPINQAHRSSISGRFPLVVFCQQLLSLLEAGLQLVEAVDTLADNELDTSQRAVLLRLKADLRSGHSFSQALTLYPDIFPVLFQAAIEASEQTGGVTEALRRFVAYESRFQKLRSRLVGALIYPALLLSLGGLVIAFLLGYVVPRFSVVFVDRLSEMPFLSGLIIRLGLTIAENPLQTSLTVICVIAGVIAAVLHPPIRNWLIEIVWQLPWLGERIREFELVRIYRSLGMLLRGGIPAVRALEMIASLAPDQSRRSIDRAIKTVSEGLPISMALQDQGLTTVVTNRLLAVGERSGQMGDMLERAADFLDDDLERTVDRAVGLVEPLMMIAIGIVIGGIVILMYLPIFELADSVG